MTERTDQETFRFDAPGTLRKPGPIGRVVRLLVGGFLLWNVWQLLPVGGPVRLDNTSLLIWLALTVWLTPYVINIGWGVSWGMRSRIVLVGLWLIAWLAGWGIQGEPVSPVLWFVLKWSSLYVMGHLGLSFVLSAVIATPGCEMRSIPHAIGLISGHPRAEHYCPGFIDAVDRWERSSSAKSDKTNTE